MKKILLLAALCAAPIDVKTIQCDVGCHWAGYDRGFFEDDACQCIERKDYDYIAKVKKMPLSNHRPGGPARTYHYPATVPSSVE